jgi:DNA-binding Lrp family transcriptional regulator
MVSAVLLVDNIWLAQGWHIPCEVLTGRVLARVSQHRPSTIKESHPMETALVLLKVRRDQVHAVAEELVDLDGITEVYSVSGRFDLAVVVRVEDNDSMEKLVTEQIRCVEGIIKSETLIAFRVYSRYDLERMFAIGMER